MRTKQEVQQDLINYCDTPGPGDVQVLYDLCLEALGCGAIKPAGTKNIHQGTEIRLLPAERVEDWLEIKYYGFVSDDDRIFWCKEHTLVRKHMRIFGGLKNEGELFNIWTIEEESKEYWKDNLA